jgi:signal peptidase II
LILQKKSYKFFTAIFLFFSCALLVFLDQGVKILTIKYLSKLPPQLIFNIDSKFEFYLTYATNKGAAWGILENYPDFLLLFRILAISLLCFYLFFKNKDSRTFYPLLLVITGAFSNLLDSFLYGHVIDTFLCIFNSWHYPVFNLADSFIFLGIVFLLILPQGAKNGKTHTA